MARKLPDRRTKFLSRWDHKEADLNHPNDIEQKIKATLPDLLLLMVHQDTPIILDISDLAKPLAKKKMDYMVTVRNGGRAAIAERHLRPITAIPDWCRQMRI